MSTTLSPESAFAIIIQKAVFDALFIFIFDNRTQVDIVYTLENISLHIRIDLLHLRDELFGLHPL